MTTQKTFLMVIVAVILTGLSVFPASAHRKYRSNPSGPPRWVLVRHSHEQAESVKSTMPTQLEAKEKGFDLLGGAFDLVAGAWKAVGNRVEAILGGKERAAGEAEKAKPAEISSRREYRYVPNRSGSGSRWIRKRIR